MVISLRFPEGRPKVLSFSYDDGTIQDKRLVEIFDKYGMKGTFNLNSGLMFPNESEQRFGNRLSFKEAFELFSDSPHEVALHGLTHPMLKSATPQFSALELLADRKNLEKLFKKPITGLAYPFGGVTEELIDTLKTCGISYGRTVSQTKKFNIPLDKKDWYRFEPTCHHNNAELFDLADVFLKETPYYYPELFFIWGHSNDFDLDNNWDRIEKFCEKMANKDDIWYATSIEIYNYFDAFYNLEFSAAMTRVFNPSAIPIWFNIDKKIYCVKANEMLEIK